jgi:hypothetical protein
MAKSFLGIHKWELFSVYMIFSSWPTVRGADLCVSECCLKPLYMGGGGSRGRGGGGRADG